MTLPFGGDGGDRTSTVGIQQIANVAWINFGDLPDGQNKAVIATAIAMAESSARPAVIGGGGYGLWQIQNNHVGDAGLPSNFYDVVSQYDPTKINVTSYASPLANGIAARKIFDMQGFNAWTVFKTNAYSKFLPQAQQAVQQAANTQGPVQKRPTFDSISKPMDPALAAQVAAGAGGFAGVLTAQSTDPTKSVPTAVAGIFDGIGQYLWIGGGAVLVILGFLILNKNTIASVAKVAAL